MRKPDDQLLPAVASALADNLGASLQEIADAAGVGRTTLHRHFPTRQLLTDAVAQHALRECERVMDACGFDDLAVPDVLDRLSREVLSLAVAYALIYAEPPITNLTDLQAEAAVQDNRFECFAARGQAEGHFRTDVPSRWIVYSIGSQAMAVGFAVRAGFIATRDVERLFLTTVLGGLSLSQDKQEQIA